ncbi:MAG: MmcQ/YjbR family DNA-binding protein [Clostridia bacterium]|nr:MmcQ/YjbR family DNA-binding protein [Clostridia bacterium]
MSIESEIFARKRADKSALLKYGFTPRGDGLFYSEPFLSGDFRAEITVDRGGTLSGKAIDRETNDEYLPLHVESRTGPFVGAVREEYKKILLRIAENCFKDAPFIFDQTGRITDALSKRFGDAPDHPFSTAPSYVVYRYPKNRKWYGLFMDVPLSRVTGEKPEKGADGPVIEAVNLKVPPEKKAELLKTPGVFDAYHMKNKSWVSVLLNDTLPDEFILGLLTESRELIKSAPAGKARGKGGARSWIVPANPDYFDIEAAFRASRTLDWKQSSDIKPGDTVYIYVGAPVSAVRYKCAVLKTDIPYSFDNGKVKMTRLMTLELQKVYPPELLPFRRLRALGVAAVRGPRTTPAGVSDLLEK